MSNEPRGRVAPSPPPPFLKGTSDSFVGAYPWNNLNKEAIGRDRPLTRGEYRQVQGVLGKVNRLPYVLKTLFNSRYDFIRRTKSPLHGFYFLKNTVEQRVGPRLERVNQLNGMNETASLLFLSERESYSRLAGMSEKRSKNLLLVLLRSSMLLMRNLATHGQMLMAVKKPFSPMKRRRTYMVTLPVQLVHST